MSSSDGLSRRALVAGLAAGLGLSACGFTPVNAPGSPARALNGAVTVAAPGDRATFELVQALEDRLGRSANPRFTLAATYAASISALGVVGSQSVTRYNITGTASYTLTELATGTVIDTGTVETFTSYSANLSTLATESAERNARKRLATALADLIVARMQLSLSTAS